MPNGNLDIQGLANRVRQRAQDIRPNVFGQVREQLQQRGAQPRVLNTLQDRLQNVVQGGVLDIGGQGGNAQVRRVEPGKSSQTQSKDTTPSSSGPSASPQSPGGGFRMPQR